MLATQRSEVAGKINDKISFGGGGGDESNGSRRGESQDESKVCAEMKKGLKKQSHRILRFIHHFNNDDDTGTEGTVMSRLSSMTFLGTCSGGGPILSRSCSAISLNVREELHAHRNQHWCESFELEVVSVSDL